MLENNLWASNYVKTSGQAENLNQKPGGNGTDDFDFAALPGGIYGRGGFSGIGRYSTLQHMVEYSRILHRRIFKRQTYNSVVRLSISVNRSVRCVR